MADFPIPNTAVATSSPPVSAALLAYGLFGVAAVMGLISSGFHLAAPLVGIVGIAGLIVAYVKRDEAQGTWVASHLRWLIRTFWFSLMWGAIGVLFAITFIGLIIAIPLWAVASIWVIYRVIRGYLLFNDSKPVPGL
jgi:uncharacterized membrane protein